MNLSGTTTQGNDFTVTTSNDEIVYLDCFGDSLTWNDTEYNRELVLAMVNELMTRELVRRVA